jgi:hypothetical protein
MDVIMNTCTVRQPRPRTTKTDNELVQRDVGLDRAPVSDGKFEDGRNRVDYTAHGPYPSPGYS